MNVSDIYHLGYPQLADAVSQAILNNDLETLEAVSATLHLRFWKEDKSEFVQGVIEILDHRQLRNLPEPSAVPRLLAIWKHLVRLANSERDAIDNTAHGTTIIESRKHAPKLLRQLKAATGPLTMAALESALEISKPNLSMLLKDLECCQAITRRKVGKEIHVSLGKLGKTYLETIPFGQRYELAKPAFSVTGGNVWRATA